MLAIIGALSGGIVMTGLTLWTSRSPAIRAARRLQAIRVRPSGEDADDGVDGHRIFQAETSGRIGAMSAWLQRYVRRIGGINKLWVLASISAVLAMGCLWFVRVAGPFDLTTDILVIVVVPSAGGLAVAAQLQRRWQISFLNGFAEAIELVIRAFRSGVPVSEAIRVAGHEIEEPVRSEFRVISDALDLGIDLKDAMRAAANRVQLADFDFLVTAMILQRETGGQLAETLENLSTILRRRKELRLKVKAMTAEGRMSAAIVGAIPVVAAFAMYFLDPQHIERLFVPGTGRTLLYVGLGFLTLGIVVVHFLTRVRP